MKTNTGPGDYWRIAVVEDHVLQRARTVELVDGAPGLRVIGAFETFPEFVRRYQVTDRRERPHLLVLDLLVERGPSVDPDVLRELIAGGLRVLVLSAMASPVLVREIVRAGVGGVVGKRDGEDEILAAVMAVLRREEWHTPELAGILAGDPDRPRLSDQEERALVLYATGLTLPAVAEVLGVKPDTAKGYLDRVKVKYAAAGRPVRTKLDMSREARRDGLMTSWARRRLGLTDHGK